MPGYATAYSACLVCKRVFGYNPTKVPSLRVNAEGQPDPAGDREPVCETCMGAVNAKRKEMGLPPHPIDPEAYEACPEHEL